MPIILEPVTPKQALKKARDMGWAEVLKEVKESNLKGRGGAGFPTGTKWEIVSKIKGPKKYLVCNADEGEPGTFKDRVLLSEYPELVFEGMAIAGLTIGANKGFLYLRGEYRRMLPQLARVLKELKLGFRIEIRQGAGAYVCGEESALIESIEGNRGEPRNRPPFPVTMGIDGNPTVVNNVETLANIPHIILKGAVWFRRYGTARSAGTKLLSISGDCKKPGVYEVQFGTTLKEVLKLAGAEKAKAVMVGGASGTCVTRKDLKRKIAYEDLVTGGSMIVLGPKRKLLDAARNFTAFFEEESCGQCTPCREGLTVLLKGIDLIKQGKCDQDYFNDLFSLAETLRLASKCGLGQSAGKSFESIIEAARGEYKLSNIKRMEENFNV